MSSSTLERKLKNENLELVKIFILLPSVEYY